MAFLDKDEIYKAYKDATAEADIWREDYPQYERLMDNGLMEGLDENLPEVNDGSLAASLFKLAKRVIKKKLGGRAIAKDSDDVWLSDFANIRWEKSILPNANSMASPRRKLKDGVRKAAGYGSQPFITIFTDHGSDFIVPYAQDVKLEAGKVSDMDSDVIFWDVYYTKLQVKNMIEQAESEEQTQDGYNKWNIEELQKIVDSDAEEDRPGNEEALERQNKGVKKSGIHFYIAFQRGVEAPFMMCHNKTPVREWSNPDPSGDVPVHYLDCYQDFINPYGVGIVKLAGGTQNVLDYMRQADILATQLGIRPPKLITGDIDSADEASFVYAEDANWYAGNAKVERMEMSNQVYTQLPGRMAMYQTSLQKMIPMGDTSIPAGESGDSQVSKTPAGVKLQAANLSIDDEDFSENVDELYAVLAKSMINYEFANMQGSDLMRLSDDERQLLVQGGLDWPTDPVTGELMGNELDVMWDEVRATFDFEIDPDADKTDDEEKQLEGLMRTAEFLSNPATQQLIMTGQPMILGTKKVDIGELIGTIVGLSSDNDKIVTDVTPEEMEQQQMMQQQIDPASGQPIEQPIEEEQPPVDPEEQQAMINVQAVMEQYGVDQNTALAMLEAERQGFSPEEVQEALQRNSQPQQVVA